MDKFSLSSILLWKIERINESDECCYDTYRAAIVAARTFDEAVQIHPDRNVPAWIPGDQDVMRRWGSNERWAPNPMFVNANLIGLAEKTIEVGTVILADFYEG